MKEKCVIITGGDFSPIVPPAESDFVIACDRGYEYAVRCDITPQLLVGDFDSYSGALPSGIPVERFRAEKDDTDTMIAVRYAVEHGFSELELCCALGGRLDHMLANLQAAVFAAGHGLTACLSDEKTSIRTMIPGKLSIPRRNGYSLSLFSATDFCEGVTIKGAKYPLCGARLTNSFPIGVSNEWRDECVELELDSGILLIVMSKK